MWKQRCTLGFILAAGSARFVLTQNAVIPSNKTKSDLKEAGAAALRRENARQQAGFCSSSETTATMNDCFTKELKITDRNYGSYAMALAGMLKRAPLGGWRLTHVSHGLREFQEGEAAWKIYRDKTCDAIDNSEDGGSGAPTDTLTCLLSLTGAHMQELDKTYSEVWHQAE
jgi:uncharacterized protein YecT (DUF1311 family)